MKQMSMIQMLFGLKQAKHQAAAAMDAADNNNAAAVAEKLLGGGEQGDGKLSLLAVDDCNKLTSPDSMNSMAPILEYGEGPDVLPLKEVLGGAGGSNQASDEEDDQGIRIEIPSMSQFRVSIVRHEDDESMWKVSTQIIPAFVLAGIGMVGAGLLLDTVTKWDIYKMVNEMFIVTPSLLGLKGNLEMTLASRLSTQANLGTMNNRREMKKCIIGNLVLTQAQACILSILSGLVATFLSLIKHGSLSDLDHYLIFFPTIILTASLATLALASLTTAVVVLCHKWNLNPDNIATPIAASLGDISTLGLMAIFGDVLLTLIDHMRYLGPLILFCFCILVPMFIYFSYRNEYVNEAIVPSGWIAIVTAMFIATFAGFILDIAVEHYSVITLYQPVVNGVGGNLVAIQASRISTYLHKLSHPGSGTADSRICLNPISAFFGSETHCRTARLLMLFVIPGHVIFAVILIVAKTGSVPFTLAFSVSYLTAVVVQVALLLFLARIIVYLVWKVGRDPDNDSIPYLTAFGDLFGIVFLAVAFTVISRFDSSVY